MMKLLSYSPSALRVEAKLEMGEQGMVLSFEVTGPGASTIALSPRSGKPARKDELWKETCFECFFGVGGSKSYYEFNGGTSGDWALYSFEDYRKGMKNVPVTTEPVLEKIQKNGDRLEVVWRIPYFTKQILQGVGITAILKNPNEKNVNDETSYWALKHAGEKPDFHLRESFTYRLI